MKFQEIDFHVELYKAFLEPKEAQFPYLDLVGKKIDYPKKALIAKLEEAYNNIKEAFETQIYLETRELIGDSKNCSMSLPIRMFERYPKLNSFSRSFSGKLNRSDIEDLGAFLSFYKAIIFIDEVQKEVKKIQKQRKQKKRENPEQSLKETNKLNFTNSEKEENPEEDQDGRSDNAISFAPNVVDKLFEGLKLHFEEKKNLLETLLQGQKINEMLCFESNGNKLTDVFYRLHEKGEILSDKKVTAKWICENFKNRNQRKKDISNYKYSTVYKQLTNMSGGIDKSKMICKDL
ncbi:MAG: hypothetical protein WD555_03650 [Fulvivirga sp.]